MAHAAATPNTRLSGTEMAAVMSVSSIALHASGSLSASTYAPQPLRSASVPTAASGSTRKKNMNVSAMAIKVQRTSGDSVVPARARRMTLAGALISALPRGGAARFAGR